jgi:hypothetical protein
MATYIIVSIYVYIHTNTYMIGYQISSNVWNWLREDINHTPTQERVYEKNVWHHISQFSDPF